MLMSDCRKQHDTRRWLAAGHLKEGIPNFVVVLAVNAGQLGRRPCMAQIRVPGRRGIGSLRVCVCVS